jgi:hypothetical protein
VNAEELKRLQDETDRKHRHWWDFCAGVDNDFENGSESMEKIEQYANEHPEIVVCGCDDQAFASSDLVLVPHPDMGITVLYVPQCSGGWAQFFLYPGHLSRLIDALTEMRDKLFR